MQNDVLRLQISMYNSTTMKFINGCTNLLHKGSSLNLRQWLTSFEVLEQLPSHCNLQNDVDVLLVFEKAVHFDYVWVVQKHLDFYLADELLYDLLFD